MEKYEIQYQLKKRGHSQSSIALALGVSEAAVSQVITGRSTSRAIMALISKLIDTDINKIWPSETGKDVV